MGPGRALEIGMTGRRYVALAAVALATALPAAVAAEPRAVIELFTSQGCSSCPPADKLLGDLAKDPTLIPLTLAIDYWDYLGWKDTLALTGHSNRQKAYSHVRGDRDVYTPQVIVNGAVQVLGSDRDAIEHAITQSRRNPTTLSVPVTLTVANGRLTAAVHGVDGEATPAEVWLCPVMKSVEVSIGRGENSGHTFTYHNVVRRWVKLGAWNGKAQTWSVPVTDFKTSGVDAVAVLVQDGAAAAPTAIVGAALIPLDQTAVLAAPALR
jgi:hypothetical protein